MLFMECDRNNPIKNFTDKLNLRELQVDDISAKFTAGKGGERRGVSNIFSTVNYTCLLLCFVR